MVRLTPLFLSLCLVAPALADAVAGAVPAERPRIGLVLSGGGARGVAHVGVLRALEEMHVPVDLIAGTSMGAVVGGLYAAGLPAERLEALVQTLDWYEAFKDRSPRDDLDFRRKQDDREYLVRLPLGVQGRRFRMPRGLIQGQKLSQVLRRETLAAAYIDDFDQLPIRFRAVATDLESGERVVLAGGDLTAAIRASMSAPGVFAPVEIEGRLLVDGGLVANLPVDVAQALGVDVVIAVDVGSQPFGRRQLNSAVAVSNQMLTIMIGHETGRQRAMMDGDDILITPELGTMSSLDFTQVGHGVELGMAATRAQAERLTALALDEEGWQRHIAARHAGAEPLPEIRFVRTDAGSERYRERILAELAPAVGHPLDPRGLERGLSRLYGDGIFESVDYRIAREGGQQGLEVAARRKSWGPNYVRFGLELQDDLAGSNSFNAGMRVLVTEVNRYGAEWQTDLRVGGSPRIFTEFYQPLGYTARWFVAPRLLIERRNADLIEDGIRVASYRIHSEEAGLDLGRELGNWGELRLGLAAGSGRRALRIGDPDDAALPGAGRFDRGEVVARFSLDRLDNVYFPRAGGLFTLQWQGARTALGADDDADRASVDGMIARSWGRNTGVLWATAGTLLSGPRDSIQDFWSLGGLFNLSGLPPEALRGSHFGIARAIGYRRIGRGDEGFLDMPVYAGLSLELGNTWDRRREIDLGSARANGALFLGFDTLLGPVYLAAGFDEDGERSFYLLLGRFR
jgi:NTE family protein